MPTTTAVPELGRLLGRLVQAESHSTTSIPLEAAKLAVVSRLFAAAGAAREAHAAGDEPAARACLRHAVWLEAWRALSADVTGQLAAEARARLTAAATAVRMPAGMVGRLLPDDAEQAVIRHRLEAAAIPLERVRPPEHAADWEEALCAAALAVDASWDRLVALVSDEMARVTGREQEILAWRRPRLVLWVLTGAVMLAAALMGLWRGGYLASPPPSVPWGVP